MMKTVFLAALFSALLVGCIEKYPHKFALGDCVRMKLDGREGMVVYLRFGDGRLRVRFAGDIATTDTRLLGGDKPIQKTPYAEVMLREFELEACQ